MKQVQEKIYVLARYEGMMPSDQRLQIVYYTLGPTKEDVWRFVIENELLGSLATKERLMKDGWRVVPADLSVHV